MAWLGWLIGSFFYFYQFFFRTIFSTIGEDIAGTFNISVSDLSMFFATQSIAYALMQIPGGVLLDYFGPRRVLSVALMTLSVGAIIISSTTHYPLALLGRTLMGIGSAFGFLGTSKLVVMWFPLHWMSFLLGVTVFIGSAGGAFSNTLYNSFPSDWSWSQTILVIGTIGIVSSLLLPLLVRERREDKSAKNSSGPQLTLWEQIRVVLTNRNIILAGLFTFFAYIPITIIGDSWGPLAFEKIFSVSKDISAQAISYFYVAFAIGSFFFSTIASFLRANRSVIIVEWVFVVTGLYALLFQTDLGSSLIFGVPGFLILSAFVGFCLGGVALAFPIGCGHAAKEVSGTVVGIINCLCMISGGLYSKLVGNVLDAHWDGVVSSDGVRIFSGEAYKAAFQPLLFTSLLALLFIVLTREAKPTPTDPAAT